MNYTKYIYINAKFAKGFQQIEPVMQASMTVCHVIMVFSD